MADLPTEAQTPYVYKGVSYPILDMRVDLAVLGSRIKDNRFRAAEAAIKNRKGWNELDIAQTLVDIQWRDVTVREILVWAQTPEGAYETVAASLRKAGVSDLDARKTVEPMLAGELVNLAMIVARGVEKPEKPEPTTNPT